MADVNVPIVANIAPKVKKIPAAKSSKKPSAVKKSPTYAAMVTTAIQELKEKKGSSRQSIMKHLQGSMKVDNPLMVNKTIKKMITDGKLVAGARAGETGSGCFKVSVEEKNRIKLMERAAAKKLKATEKKATVTVPGKKVKPSAAKKKVAKATIKKTAVTKKGGAKAKAMKKVKKATIGAKAKKGAAKPKKFAAKPKKIASKPEKVKK